MSSTVNFLKFNDRNGINIFNLFKLHHHEILVVLIVFDLQKKNLQIYNYRLLCQFLISTFLGLICGSGLGTIADQVQNKICLDYDEIPHMHKTG